MIRRLLEGQRQPVWYSLASILISVFLVAGIGAAFVTKTVDNGVRESERKQCGLIVIIDDYFNKTTPLPPASDDAQAHARVEYARAVHQQRIDFHCDEKRNK